MADASAIKIVQDTLPSSWAVVTFEDICDYIQRGKSPKYGTDPSHPVINQKCIRWDGIYKQHLKFIKKEQWNSLEESRFIQDGDILWNSTGSGTIGRACIISAAKLNKATVDSHVTIVRVCPLVSQEYVYYYIRSPFVQQRIDDMQTGSTNQVELGKKVIQESELPIAPFSEQTRIISKIEELFSDLDKGEESLRQAQAQLKRYRQSVLKAAVTGELTRDWREQNRDRLETGEALLKRILKARREAWEKAELEKMQAKGVKPKDDSWKKKYVEPKGPDTTGLPELPEGWVWASMGQLLCKIEAGKNFKCEERPPSEDEVGIVKVSAVTWGAFDENESKTITNEEKIDERYVINEGDFLFSRANTLELVGACLIVCGFRKKLLLSDKILRFIFPFDLKQLVDISLKSNIGREQIERYSSGNQESMRNISQENIYKIAVPLPPLDEVRQVLNRFSLLSCEGKTMELYIKSSQRDLTKLRQSILKSAFSGTLVPQDPNDEPASELLKRIAAEKAASAITLPARRSGPRQKRCEAQAPAKQVELLPVSPPKQTVAGLAQLRKAAGMSQAELAKAIGLNQAYISQMETGKRVISKEIAKAISIALNVDLTSLAV